MSQYLNFFIKNRKTERYNEVFYISRNHPLTNYLRGFPYEGIRIVTNEDIDRAENEILSDIESCRRELHCKNSVVTTSTDYDIIQKLILDIDELQNRICELYELKGFLFIFYMRSNNFYAGWEIEEGDLNE